jgi:DNA-binding beta-propeller fold protein YncE
MRRDPLVAILVVLAGVFLAACGGATGPQPDALRPKPAQRTHSPRAVTRTHQRAAPHRQIQALVTAETENRLLIADLRNGKITRVIALPAGPQYVAAEPGLAVVTSTTAGTVTLLKGDRLHVAKLLHGFGSPRITELAPHGGYGYVTDDARGTLTAIQLGSGRVISKVRVGAGAHHLAVSPDERRIWVALGESATTIVTLTTCVRTCSPTPLLNPGRPRATGRFDPGFRAHDLDFSPDGRRVWISSATGPEVGVFRASDHLPLFRVPVGPPPQHIVFDGSYAYLTSGYGSTIEKVAASTGRVIARARAPYGSFELAAADGYVATASLLNGELAVYTRQLRLLRTRKLAPATRDLEISDAAG